MEWKTGTVKRVQHEEEKEEKDDEQKEGKGEKNGKEHTNALRDTVCCHHQNSSQNMVNRLSLGECVVRGVCVRFVCVLCVCVSVCPCV